MRALLKAAGQAAHGEKTDMITMMCNQEDDIPLEKRYINEIY